MTRAERAIYVDPELARQLFGVRCAQAFLDGPRLHYFGSGRWCTMQPGSKRFGVRPREEDR